MTERTLVLRLAAPMQSWGTTSQFNRRATSDRPSKAGVLGILAAAQGRRRGDEITDLLGLSLGVRVDQAGSLMHDYHTVSTLTGAPLLAAKVNAKGKQVATGPKKFTHVTRRDYLQDAIFVVAVSGDQSLIDALAEAVTRPRFPLGLGRRSCPPTHPLRLTEQDSPSWEGNVVSVLTRVPWQGGHAARRRTDLGSQISLSATLDDPDGDDILTDVPMTFSHTGRGYAIRRVRHVWIPVPTGREASDATDTHDPFSLLGW